MLLLKRDNKNIKFINPKTPKNKMKPYKFLSLMGAGGVIGGLLTQVVPELKANHLTRLQSEQVYTAPVATESPTIAPDHLTWGGLTS